MIEIKQRLGKVRNWLGLIENLEAEAEQIEDKQQRSQRLFWLGQLCEEVFLRKDRAMASYQRAFKLFPQDANPLIHARQIYWEMGNLSMVAKLMEFQRKLVTDPMEQTTLLLSLATIALDLGRLDQAAGFAEQAAELAPDHPRVEEMVRLTGLTAETWEDEVLALMEQADELGAEQAEEAARLLLTAARIQHIFQPDEAQREDLLRKAVELAPDQLEANFLLEQLLFDAKRYDEILALHRARLERVPEALVPTLAQHFATMWSIRFGDDARAAEFFQLVLSHYYGGNGDAFTGHVAAYRRLCETAAQNGSSAEPLLELANRALGAEHVPAQERAQVAAEAAALAWRQLGDLQQAADLFSVVQAEDPEHALLEEFLAEHSDAMPQVMAAEREEAEVVEEVEDVAEVEAEAEAEVEAEAEAEVEAEAEAEPEPEADAEAEPEADAEAEPEPEADAEPEEEAEAEPEAEAEQEAEEAAEAEPEAEEAVEEPEEEAAEAEPEAEEAVEEPEEEVAAEPELAPRREPEPLPEVPETVEEEVDEPTAKLFAEAAEAEAESPEKGIDAWRKAAQRARRLRTPRRALARLYTQVERWNALVDVLKEEVELVEADAEKMAMLFQMVELYRDKLNLDMMVVSALNQILAIDPARLEVLDGLADQYEKMKRWTDLIATLKKKADAVDTAAEKVEIWSQVASLFVDRFNNQAEAIKAYEEILELDPSHQEAMEALKTMYERRRDWEKLIGIHQREIEMVADEEERRQRTIELAELASSKLKRPQVSEEMWGKVLELDPDNLKALQQLEMVYDRSKEWERLADVCQRQVALTDDAKRKVQVLQKLGILFTDKMKEPARGIEAWQQLLEVEPNNRRAQDTLKKLYLAERDYEALEAFYAGQNKWDEFIRVIERQADQEDDETKLALLFKVAGLWQEQLDKPDRAARAYEKILALDENSLEAAEALIPIYAGGRDVKKYARVLEIQLDHTEDDELKVERLRQLAELLEQKMRDKDGALDRTLQALAIDGQAQWVREEAERLAEETGRWSDLVAAYEEAIERLMDPLDRLPLMLTVGRVYEEELASTEDALRVNREILDIEPQNEQAVSALVRLYTATEQWSELLEVYQRKIDLTEDPEERKEIYNHIALLYEEEIGDNQQAIEAYRTVLDLAGEDAGALKALERIYEAESMWEDLAETLLRELALVDPEATEEVVGFKFRLGALRETQLDDVVGAVECYRDVIELMPEHEGARTALERWLSDETYQLDAARILEPIYAELSAWEDLVGVYEIQLGREDDPLARVDLLQRIGKLWVEKLADGAKAFDAYSRCFNEDPNNEAARAELERLAEIEERWEPLAGLYEAAVAEPLDAPLMLDLLLKLAAIFDEQLQQPERAMEFFRRAQELEPDNPRCLDALERLYTRAERWSDLLEVYRRQAEMADEVETRLDLYFRIATLWEEAQGELVEAVNTYQEILTLDDGNTRALKALDRIYQAQENWPDLADNLVRQLDLAEEQDEVVELRLRLAELRLSQLAETEAAVETYRQVLELDPANETAVAALEGLLQSEEHQLTVAQVLEPIYKQLNDWQQLIEVYEIMVSHSYDPESKIGLLHRIAELHELAGEDAASAFEVYGRALREDPGREETQSQLHKLADQLSCWTDLVALYNELVADVMDDVLVIALHKKVALIHEEMLDDPEAAAAAYNRILEVDPQNLDAIDALRNIFTRTEQHEALVEVLLKRAEAVLEPDERKALLFQAAQIYQELLENPDEAIRVYLMVLEIDDSDAEAMGLLERLYLQLERWEALRDLYLRKVEQSEEPDEKKALYYRVGMIYEQQLEDPERAIETYTSVIDLDPDDLTALQALDRLYIATERWYDLLQVLERQVELAGGTSQEAVAFRFRIGQLWQNELGDLARAVETYREVLGIDPTHEPTVQALDTLAHGEEEAVMAAQVLEPIYEQTAEWAQLIDLCEVMVQHADDPYRKVELLHRIAELYELQLDDGAKAFDAFVRALRQDNGDEQALANLERLAEQTGAWEALAALYEEVLDKMFDADQQVQMGLRVARVYEEELGQVEQAIAKFRQVLDVDTENQQAILALDRLYEGTEQWPELADNLKLQVQTAQTEEDIVALQFRLGQVYQERLEDTAAAVECYRDILAASPEHGSSVMALELMLDDGLHQAEIAEILEPLYRMGEQWEKLLKIMEVQLARTEDPFDRVQGIQRMAEIAEQRLGDHGRAFEFWGRALLEDPFNEVASEELERIAQILDGWEQLAGLYGAAVEKIDAEESKRLLAMQARVFEFELYDAARAEQAHVRILHIDPQDAPALEALDRIYSQNNAFEALAEILTRRIAITDSIDEMVDLQLRLGETYDVLLENPEAAIEAYTAVLDMDSANVKALDALEKIYFDRNQWQDLYGVYERMMDIAPGDAGRADCFARMAKISSDALDDPERAKDLWNSVLDLRGEDPVALWALADLYEAAEEWKDLVEVLQRQVLITSEPADQVRLYKRLGRIYGENLGRDRNALESWARVLEIDPSDTQALYAMAAIFQRTEAWEELAQTLTRLIDLGMATDLPSEEMADLFTRLAQLKGEVMLSPHEAIDAWRKVLDYRPADFGAMAALERLLTDEAMWPECVAVLMHKADLMQGTEEKIAVLLQAAGIWQEKQEDNVRAIEVYEQVMALDADHAEAFEQLRRLYREEMVWEKLTDMLIDWATEREPDGERKVEILQEAAVVFEEKLDSTDNAFLVLQAAFSEDYTNDITARNFERLASATGKWDELLQVYYQVVQEISDKEVKADLLVKMGKWYGSELGNMEYANAYLSQAMQLNPECVKALEVQADFHRQAGRWSELVATRKKQADLEKDPQKKVVLLLDLAELYETQLEDEALAVAAYRRAIDTDETNDDALKALERLYRNNQQWDALIEVLDRKARASEEIEEVIDLRRRIGELYTDQLGNDAKAIAAYGEILNIDPINMPALRALEQLYERTEQSEAYLDVLERQLDISESQNERISLYQRMAAVYEEKWGKLERAADCLEKVLDLDPGHDATFRALERIYQQDGRYTELVATLERHIGATGDLGHRVELYLAMGQVYELSLKDPDRAIEAYNNVLDVDPNHTGALDALARLYEGIEAWDRALDVMERLTHLVDDVPYRVGVLFRIGVISEDQLADQATAERHYTEVVSLDPTHVPAMSRLVELYKLRADWSKAASMMVRAVEHAQNPLEKSRLLYEAGAAFLQHLDDEAQAVDLLARCLEVDPDHEQAGEPLAGVYFRDGRFAEAEPILDMLVRKADRRDAARLQDLYVKLARCADELGKVEKALKYYRAAYDIDSTHLGTLSALADLLFRQEDWSRSFKIYQTILVHHRDSQRPEDIVEIYYRLGTIKHKLGERKKALNMFEKALEINGSHRGTLQTVIEIQAAQNDWEAVASAKRALLPVADEEERFTLLDEIGDLYHEKLQNAPKAVEFYREALAVKSDSHVVLHKLLELYYEVKQWRDAVDIIQRLTELEPQPERRSKYFYTAAVICRDEMGSLDEAVDYFNKALDEDFNFLKAFEAIDKLATKRKDWKALERAYRKMIKRLPQEGHVELKGLLWHNLGEIYRTRVRDFRSAATAFEVAASLQPDNLDRHEILAELYMLVGPDMADKAVAEHQILIKNSPFKFDSYKALRKIYMDTKQYDKAWCLCATLAFLKKADPEEQQFFLQYRSKKLVQARSRVTDELWHRRIFHPDEDRYISAIFGTLCQAVATMYAKPHKAFKLKRKERRDLASDPAAFTRVFGYVMSVLGVQAELYFRQEQPTGLQMANTTEVTSYVVGAELLSGRQEKELAFEVGKELTFLRPEHFLRRVLGSVGLMKAVFFAGLKMVDPKFPVPPADAPAVEQTVRTVQGRMHPSQLEVLAGLVRKFAGTRAAVNLNAWWNATDLTANRVGFILCNDLEVAARRVGMEPGGIGAMSPKEKVKDLVLYSISEDYFTVRKQLGYLIAQQ